MTKSSASNDQDDKLITVNPADHTKLKSMKITAAGPGGDADFDVKAGDLKKAEEAADHQTTLTSGKVTLTLTYAGNMKDGFDLPDGWIEGRCECEHHLQYLLRSERIL